jgi:hypothetical protein
MFADWPESPAVTAHLSTALRSHMDGCQALHVDVGKLRHQWQAGEITREQARARAHELIGRRDQLESHALDAIEAAIAQLSTPNSGHQRPA